MTQEELLSFTCAKCERNLRGKPSFQGTAPGSKGFQDVNLCHWCYVETAAFWTNEEENLREVVQKNIEYFRDRHGRTTIANLFVNQLERHNSVRKLQVHCKLLRSELIQTAQVIDTVHHVTGIIPPLDLQSFRDAVLSAEWFLADQDLLGQVESTGTAVDGLYTNIHELNVLNTTIDIFNREQMSRVTRYNMFSQVLDKWKPHRNEFKNIIRSLEGMVQRCEKFLQLS